MSIEFHCDRCKKNIEKGDIVTVCTYTPRTHSKDYHLCTKCWYDLILFLGGRDVIHNK